MNLKNQIGLPLIAFVLAACSGERTHPPAPNALKSDGLAFSVGKLALGMDKESARAVTPLERCAEKRYGRVECTGYFEAAFFGGRVALVQIGFIEPSKQVSSLEFFVDAQAGWSADLSRSWQTGLRCLTGSEARNLHDRAVPVAGDLVPELQKLDLVPYSDEGFACIAADARFVHVGARLESGSRSVKMMYLNTASEDLFSRVVQAAEDQRAREEQLKKF